MKILRERIMDRLPLALLFFIWAFFHHRVLWGGQAFVLEDSSRFFFPLWKWGAEVWAKGWVPLWNPDAAFGTPYLADPQMGAWYPPIFLAYHFWGPVPAFNGLIIGHHLWAVLGLWFFARTKGYDPWLSFSGSLIYGFSFNALSLSWACAMLFAYSWVPWVFLAAEGLIRRRKNAFWIFSIVLSLQLAAGYPLFFYLTLFTLLLDRSIHLVIRHDPGPGWGKEIPWILSGAFLAMGYNAAWLIPFREFIPLSNLALRAAFSQSLGWGDLGSWFNPFLKGHPLHSNAETPFSVTVFFVGLPFLVVLFWGMLMRKIKYPLILLFFLLLILSLGETVGLGEWLKSFLPGYYLVVRSGYWIPFVIWTGIGIFLEVGNRILSDGK